MRTIPHMCLACSEIVDVAIPIDETEPSGCPMCGGELTCDFDMPANEHVTIEVQTRERFAIAHDWWTPAEALESVMEDTHVKQINRSASDV